MSNSTGRNRQPQGVPTGGQFAPEQRSEAEQVTLIEPDEPADGPLARIPLPDGSEAFVDTELTDTTSDGIFGDIEGYQTVSFRAQRQQADGNWEVVDVSYGEGMANGTVPDVEPGQPLLLRCVHTTICEDPDNPGGTEITCDYEYGHDLGYEPGLARREAEAERLEGIADPYSILERPRTELSDGVMPPGTPPEWSGTTVVSANGITFNVRFIPAGSRYGRDYKLTADKDTVEFYDSRYAHTPHGQRVSAYYADTLAETSPDAGLNLDGGVDDWSIDRDALSKVRNWAATKRQGES